MSANAYFFLTTALFLILYSFLILISIIVDCMLICKFSICIILSFNSFIPSSCFIVLTSLLHRSFILIDVVSLRTASHAVMNYAWSDQSSTSKNEPCTINDGVMQLKFGNQLSLGPSMGPFYLSLGPSYSGGITLIVLKKNDFSPKGG